MIKNPILLTDSYSLSHEFLKINKDFEVAHFYNRTGATIFNGLSDIVNELLSIQITKEMVDEAELYATENAMPFPREIWDRVVSEFDGYCPIKIQAVKEGTYCPIYTPCIQIRNTVEGFGELVTWFEGVFIKVFFSSSLLYRANEMRAYLDSLVPKFGSGVLWKLNSFGFRGTNSLEDSKVISTAWSTRLFGTDDFHVNQYIKQDKDQIHIGSIMAQAHKVVEQFDNEIDAYYHAIDEAKRLQKNIVALVIDTYCPYNFINNLMEKVVKYAISQGVHVVLRPDSSDTMAQAVLIYNKKVELGLTNVSVIIGDSITYHNYKDKDKWLESQGVPLDFVFYGMGAGFYKDIVRDTDGWASKLAYSNGEARMKFSADEFKISIPDIVNLVYNEQGQLIVEREELVSNGLYETYYEGTKDSVMFKPSRSREDYVEFSKFVASQNTTQERIILSESIQAIKEQIKAKHFN